MDRRLRTMWLFAAVAACSGDGPTQQDPGYPEVLRDVAYGTDARHVLDSWRADTAAGCRVGDPDPPFAGRRGSRSGARLCLGHISPCGPLDIHLGSGPSWAEWNRFPNVKDTPQPA